MLSEKQILILKEIANSPATISFLSRLLSRKMFISQSTLKYNIYRLNKLGFVEYENSSPVKLTPLGKLALKIIEGGDTNG